MELTGFGRALVVAGVVMVALGLVLSFSDRIPLVGRLPGDITLRGDGWAVYLPIATSIVLSVLLTIVLSLLSGWGRR